MAFAFAATVWDAVSNRKTLFAEPMTTDSRSRVLRLVIFALLPLSIIFHEFGHAFAIRAFGREVLDFGFFFFYGYVSYDPRGLSPTEEGLIALAGPLVSVIIGLLALAIGWFRPMRTAFASMLLLFGILELANALVFYPVMDAIGAVGEGGDWRVIYSTETPVIGIPVAIFHAAILAGGIFVWRSGSIRSEYAVRTGRVRRTRAQIGKRSELARIMSNAAGAASNQWKHPIELVADAQLGGIQMIPALAVGGLQARPARPHAFGRWP